MRCGHYRLDGDYMLCSIDRRSTCCSSVGKLWQTQDILAVLFVSNLYDIRIIEYTYAAKRLAANEDLERENMILVII